MKEFKDLLKSKINIIYDKSLLKKISDEFYIEIHKKIKNYIIKNKDKYKTFIDDIFLNNKDNISDSTFLFL